MRERHLTCGLRIVPNPTSDNLTPQETTNQGSDEMGQDEAGLSCPGSSAILEESIFPWKLSDGKRIVLTSRHGLVFLAVNLC